MPGLGRYFNRIIKKIIDSDYGDAVAGEVQATCAIGSVVDLQNLPGTTLVLRVVFNLKTKLTAQSRLLSRQPKSQTRRKRAVEILT